MNSVHRRRFLQLWAQRFPMLGLPALANLRLCAGVVNGQGATSAFKLSLNERSIAPAIESGLVDHLDFTRIAREELDIRAVDYVTSLFREKLHDESYLTEMNRRAAEFGVRNVLLIVENEGDLACEDNSQRKQSLKKHLSMIDVGQALGCSGVCVQPRGTGDSDEVAKRLVGSLQSLCEVGELRKINVMVSNRGISNISPEWLLRVVDAVGNTKCGIFSYFDGFKHLNPTEGLEKVMPSSKGVCAVSKSTEDSRELHEKRFREMLEIVSNSGYRGYLSLEYQGNQAGWDGIRSMRQVVKTFLEENA
jgi:hypothetical protein